MTTAPARVPARERAFPVRIPSFPAAPAPAGGALLSGLAEDLLASSLGRATMRRSRAGSSAAPPSTIDEAIEKAQAAKAAQESGGDWVCAKDLSIDAAKLFLKAAGETTDAARKDKLKAMAGEWIAAAEVAKQKAEQQQLAEFLDLEVPSGTLGSTPPPVQEPEPRFETEPEPALEPEPETVPQPEPLQQLELLVKLSWQQSVQLPLQVTSTSSIPELMTALHALVGSPPDPAKGDILLFNTRPLQQQKGSVANCGLTNGSRLFLVGDTRVLPAQLAEAAPIQAPGLGMPPAPQSEVPLWKKFRHVPQEPRDKHVLDVDAELFASRWLRLRPPGGAEAFDAEVTVRSRKGRQWRLEVFREPPGGGAGDRIGEYTGGGSDHPEPHYGCTMQSGEAIRLQISAVEPRGGDKLEVCYKVLAKEPSRPATLPLAIGRGASEQSRHQAQVDSEQLQRRMQEKRQTVEYLRREGIPADELEAELVAMQAELTALQSTAQGGGAILDYPAASFDYLESLRDKLASSNKFPTAWEDIPPVHGIVAPFTTELATAMSVKRRFKSKAQPFWVQFKVASGEKIIDCVMKSGDDLRQDQVVLGMLECFNRVWAREGVTHRLNGGGQTPVRAPLYRCLACGTDRGFVEMLRGARPIEDLVEKRSRGENGWKSGALAAVKGPFFAAHLYSLSRCRTVFARGLPR